MGITRSANGLGTSAMCNPKGAECCGSDNGKGREGWKRRTSIDVEGFFNIKQLIRTMMILGCPFYVLSFYVLPFYVLW